jgi:hypothetical protein
MLTIQLLAKQSKDAYSRYLVTKTQYKVQEALGGVSKGGSSSGVISKEHVDESYYGSIFMFIILIVWLILWIWAFFLIFKYAKIMEPWEIMIALILQLVLGSSLVVIIYIQQARYKLY